MRAKVWFLSLSLTVLVSPASWATSAPSCKASAEALDPAALYGTDKLEFEIHRKGDIIGRHTINFVKSDPGLTVTHNMEMAVKFLFVTAYRLTYEATETWCGKALYALSANVDRNGKPASLSARREGNTIAVESSRKGSFTLDADIHPSNHWNAAVLGSSQILNTLTGGPNDVAIENLGEETIVANGTSVEATRYRYTGELDADVWYDAEGRWVKLMFPADDRASAEKDDSFIEYVCTQCRP